MIFLDAIIIFPRHSYENSMETTKAYLSRIYIFPYLKLYSNYIYCSIWCMRLSYFLSYVGMKRMKLLKKWLRAKISMLILTMSSIFLNCYLI